MKTKTQPSQSDKEEEKPEWRSDRSGSSSKSYGYVDFASVAYPTLVGEKAAVFAIAYQQQADFSYLGRKPFNFNTGGAGNTEVEIKGGNYAVSPSFAIQLTNTLWLGAALNIQRSKSVGVVGGSSLPEETTSWGKNRTLNLGLMLDLDKTRLGFIARPRLGGEEATGLPLTFGAGVSHRPNDALTIAADVEYARWFELTPGRSHPAAVLTLGRTVDVRLGFEYVKKTDFCPFLSLLVSVLLISSTICISREIQCLPYAGFLN